MAITIRSVSKRFGGAVALDDVSLEVPDGSLTALLGPSGGGKSTLLRVVAGLEVPDSGTVEFDGQDVTGVPVRDRGIGFCFQHYAPFRHLTVRRNVSFGLEVRKRGKDEIRAKVDELLDLVKIDHLADRYPSQLSGGQRQRMALARALAIEPQLLLLDEPFGALDAQVRQELRVWLRELHEKISVTTVLVTHDQEEAMEVADHLAIINEGRLEQIGHPAEMYDHPANEFVMKFLGPATRLEGEWVRPHDLVIHRDPAVGDHAGTVERVTHLGFEVRVDVAMARGGAAWVQLSRGAANELDLASGDPVWISKAGASGRPADDRAVHGPALDGTARDEGAAPVLAAGDLAPTPAF
jgi:sulfate/thiosulfate transport system ATP-binding protein